MVVGHVAPCGVAHVGTHGESLVGRPNRTCHKTWLFRSAVFFSHSFRYACSLESHLAAMILKVIVCLRDTLRAESVCRNNVGTCFEILSVYVFYNVLACYVEHVVVALHLCCGVGKTAASEILFRKAVFLNHGAHGSIENQNTFLSNIFNIHTPDN